MKRLVVVLAVIGLLTIGVWGEERLDVYFLNVGHGDAILVKYRTVEWLIDTGYENAWLATDHCAELPGVPIDLPIEYFVLTHADLDHYSALDYFLCPWEVGQAFSSPDELTHHLLVQEVQSESERCTPAPVDILLADDPHVFEETGLEWMVLHPTEAYAARNHTTNDESVVLLLTFGSVNFLFTGDIQSSAERTLQTRPQPCGNLVLKVAHHGSDTSTSPEFLCWADPELAIVSADHDDLSESVARTLGLCGVPFLTTHENGTICVSTDGTSIRVRTRCRVTAIDLTASD